MYNLLQAKKKSAKIQLVQRAELRDTGSNWSYEDRKSEVSFTLVNKNKKGMINYQSQLKTIFKHVRFEIHKNLKN